MRKIVFLLGLLFVSIDSCFALCSNSTLAKIRKEVNNINFSTDYEIRDNEAYFNVTINNLTEDMYFIDNIKTTTYYYKDTNAGEITLKDYNIQKISYTFYATGECSGKKLITKYVSFPYYNNYYNRDICNGYENFYVCNRWQSNQISYSAIEKNINDYKTSLQQEAEEENTIVLENTFLDDILNFYVKYYYIILGITILVCVTIIIIYRRKNNFKI